jgi:hypothetical protein
MVTINGLAKIAIDISGKNINIDNIDGDRFMKKYGFSCPLGVKGRNSDNKLYRKEVGVIVNKPLSVGMRKTYEWVEQQVKNTKYIYESPDNGKTIKKRKIIQ